MTDKNQKYVPQNDETTEEASQDIETNREICDKSEENQSYQLVNNISNSSNQVDSENMTEIENTHDKTIKKEQIQTNKKNKQIKYNILLAILMLTTSYLLFDIFVKPTCPPSVKRDDDCIDAVLVPQIKVWIICIFFTDLLIYLVILLSFKGYFNRFSKLPAFGLAIYLIFIHHGKINMDNVSLRNYSSAQSVGLIAGFIGLFFFQLIVQTLIFLYKKFKIMIICICTFSIIFFIYTTIYVGKSCNNWEQGLAKSMDMSDEYCYVPKPTACWPNVIDGWFNFGQDTCAKDMTNEQVKYDAIYTTLFAYKIITKDTPKKEVDDLIKNYKFMGWPKVNEFPEYTRTGEYRIINRINNEKVRYDTYEDALKDEKEVIIDVQNQEMHLNVFRDEELVKQRQELIKEKNITSLADNIIVVYIDTVSRPQVYRKLKKFVEYLKPYAQYNSTEYEEEQRNKKAFEMFRYHSTDSRTHNNAFKLQFDIIQSDIDSGKVSKDTDHPIRSFFTDFKDQGYITAHSSNTLSLKSVFRSYPDLHPYFEEQYCDHEFFNFDPAYINPYNIFAFKKGTNSIYRRCIYQKDTNYHPFDYGEKFLDAYKDEKKFLYLEFTDGHEVTSEIVQYIDENLTNFFKNIEKKGHLDKSTAVYFLSDHGQHLLSAFQIFSTLQFQGKDVYQLERMLPFFYMMMTNDILKKTEGLQDTLVDNEQNIFGIGNFRQTLMGTAYGVQNVTATKDSLLVPLDHDRSCLDIGMVHFSDPKIFCSCLPYKGFNDYQDYIDSYND